MAAIKLVGVRLDACDVTRIANFWATLLGWECEERPHGVVAVVPHTAPAYALTVCPVKSPKTSPNRIHFDVTTESATDMRQMISRSLALGGAEIDIGQAPDEPHTVLADPEGNEFCVIPPENRFLADTGVVGAINCDGSQALGYFWSAALGWPLVWDQDEETAIQSPAGGSKITWSGPPLMPRKGRDRLRLELTTSDPMSVACGHLVSLGAREGGPQTATEASLYDPDGNEFHLTVDSADR
ncbi:VOC family protein [Demetria terragena]|uniref:VOC family protein n=1 Tax=Demetria terragena TaxID=63959 RepID=UPI0003616E54|nr:VOC family protein [Demetria terragena]